MEKVRLYDFFVHYVRSDGTKAYVPVFHVKGPQYAIAVVSKYISDFKSMRAVRIRFYIIDYMYIERNFLGFNTYKRGCGKIPGKNRNAALNELKRRLEYFGLKFDSLIEIKVAKNNE